VVRGAHHRGCRYGVGFRRKSRCVLGCAAGPRCDNPDRVAPPGVRDDVRDEVAFVLFAIADCGVTRQRKDVGLANGRRMSGNARCPKGTGATVAGAVVLGCQGPNMPAPEAEGRQLACQRAFSVPSVGSPAGTGLLSYVPEGPRFGAGPDDRKNEADLLGRVRGGRNIEHATVGGADVERSSAKGRSGRAPVLKTSEFRS